MNRERLKEIQTALQNASTAYREAAQDEMGGSYSSSTGSVWNVYYHMKESMALESKARRLSQRHGISLDNCNCA